MYSYRLQIKWDYKKINVITVTVPVWFRHLVYSKENRKNDNRNFVRYVTHRDEAGHLNVN
jgi:hypothetical protein